MYLRIPGHPQPKERPRSKGGQKGVYQPITEYERTVTKTAQLELSRTVPFSGEVSVGIHFHCFGSRGDIDNLTKAVLDGLNESGCWRDDKDVTHVQAFIHKAATKDEEQTLITITSI